MKYHDEIPMPRSRCFIVNDGRPRPSGAVLRPSVTPVPRTMWSWSYYVGDVGASEDFRAELVAVIRELPKPRAHHSADAYTVIQSFNDDPDVTGEERVAVWDEAARRKGFERTDKDWP